MRVGHQRPHRVAAGEPPRRVEQHDRRALARARAEARGERGAPERPCLVAWHRREQLRCEREERGELALAAVDEHEHGSHHAQPLRRRRRARLDEVAHQRGRRLRRAVHEDQCEPR